MDVVHLVHLLPEHLGAVASDRTLGEYRPSKSHDIGRGVVTLHTLPTGVLGPVPLEDCTLFVEGIAH